MCWWEGEVNRQGMHVDTKANVDVYIKSKQNESMLLFETRLNLF